MIAKMAKYDFVLYAAQSEDFIEKLRELGLVDITTTGWEPSEEDRQLLLDIEEHTKAAEFLKNFRAGEGAATLPPRRSLRAPRPMRITPPRIAGDDAQRRDRAAGKSGRGAASLGRILADVGCRSRKSRVCARPSCRK